MMVLLVETQNTSYLIKTKECSHPLKVFDHVNKQLGKLLVRQAGCYLSWRPSVVVAGSHQRDGRFLDDAGLVGQHPPLLVRRQGCSLDPIPSGPLVPVDRSRSSRLGRTLGTIWDGSAMLVGLRFLLCVVVELAKLFLLGIFIRVVALISFISAMAV